MRVIATSIFPGDVIREIINDGERDRYCLVTQVDRLEYGVSIIFGHESQLMLKNTDSLDIFKGTIDLPAGKEEVEGW